MLRNINHKLNDLARPLDFISPEDAKYAVRAVCEKLKEIVDDAYIVDVYWKKDSSNGQSILDPFISIRSDTAEKVSIIIISDERGILPWVQKKGKIAWIDDVRNKDWKKPVLNLAAVDGLKEEKKFTSNNKELDWSEDKYIQPSETLNSFSSQTECIMAYPLKYRGQVWGVLSIELTMPKKYDSKINYELFYTARLIASLIWKSDVQDQNASETKEAVSGFVTAITKQEEDVIDLTHNPSGFMARPFDEIFDQVECAIQSYISHVEIYHSKNQGKELIINEIKKQIQKSHFCIADITGFNVNVLIELGMMMNDRDKRDKIIIIKNIEDKNEIPFDINQHPVYHYFFKEKSLYIQDPAAGSDIYFKPTLLNLVNKYIRK